MNLETKVILTDLLLMLLPFLAVYFHISRLTTNAKKQGDVIDKQRMRIDELEFKANHPLKFKVGDKAMYGRVAVIVDEINLVKLVTHRFMWEVRCISTYSNSPYSFIVDGYYELKPYKEETPITPQTNDFCKFTTTTHTDRSISMETLGLTRKTSKRKSTKKK